MSLILYKGLLFSGSADHTIRGWDIHDGCCLVKCEEHRLAVSSLEATTDFLISGSFDGRIRLWSVEVKQDKLRKIVDIQCRKVLDGIGRAAIHQLLISQSVLFCARERNRNEEYNTIFFWQQSSDEQSRQELPSKSVQNLRLTFREKINAKKSLDNAKLETRVKRRTTNLRNQKVLDKQLAEINDMLHKLEQVFDFFLDPIAVNRSSNTALAGTEAHIF